MANEITFTPKEISYIDKNMGYVVFDWAKHLIQHILSIARKNNAEIVYMNTSKTVDSGSTQEMKLGYFYEKLPPIMGFTLKTVNLRGKKEALWEYKLDKNLSAGLISMLKIANVSLQNIPKNLQGAFIGILGRKPEYTNEEIEKVIKTIENRKGQKSTSTSKYFYDWDSTQWTGGQRFHKNITEMVVLQKLPNESQELISQDPILSNFWSLLLSKGGHFGPDVIGFGLVCKMSQKIWVINEIQTDCLNTYMKIRGQYYKDIDKKQTEMTWETIKDMLEAQNRSNWIPFIEQNEDIKQKIKQDPNIIQQLPDNSHDIQKIISKLQNEPQHENNAEYKLDLIRRLQSVNFNTRIFKLY